MARATPHISTPPALGRGFHWRKRGTQRTYRPALVVLCVSLLAAATACKREGNESSSEVTVGDAGANEATLQRDASPWVDMTGEFRRVVKPVRGRVDVVYRDGKFRLYLSGVSVEAEGPLRVFLVGHENAATTRIVTESKLVYDMAALDNGAAEQVIELPSRPDERIRSVVIWQQAFAVNLAFAPLQPAPSVVGR